MTAKQYLLLGLGGLVVALLAAALQPVPGYMDAEYYFAGGLRLAAGQGGSEPYVWNYLNHPASVPAPSFSYWMPLVSLIAAAGLWLVPHDAAGEFWAARIGFIFLAALLPPLTAALSYRLVGRRDLAVLAGVLALFPGFYLAYLTTTDAFALYMFTGGLFFWLAARPFSARPLLKHFQWLAVGGIAGAMHLARADGLLWLVAGLALAFFAVRAESPVGQDVGRRLLVLAWPVGLVLAGYSVVMGPWFARNLQVWGSLTPPGNGRTMWITAYEQTMIYPPDLLTPAAWLSAGWGAIAQARLDALVANLQSTIAVQGGVVLWPFTLIGLWKLRACLPVRLAAGMWLLTFGLMTVVFPFAGINGAYFHSGAAFQCLWWAAAPLGIEAFVLWLARLRRWQRGGHVLRFLTALLVLTGLLLTAGLYLQRVVGVEQEGWAWSRSSRHYNDVEAHLKALGLPPEQSVLVNNPPGFFLASGRAALVIPYGDEAMLLRAARDYAVSLLVLEDHNPPMLKDLYELRSKNQSFEYLGSVDTTRLFRIHLLEVP